MSTILIADDVRSEAELMSQVVRGMGHSTLTATDGETCLEMARKHKPDLILLDIVMPQMDGFDVCRRLKKDPETAKIPVLMVSSKSQRSDKFWAERLGANDYVTKPFQPEDLTEKIKKHLP